MVSRVGDDDLGRELRAEVRRLGMIDEHIQTDPVHPTGTVTVQLDIAGQPTYTIIEDVAWDYIEWTDDLRRLAQGGGVVCYGPLGQRFPQSRQTIRAYLESSKEKSTLVCDINLRPPFTPREAVAAVVKEADWLKLNQSEISEVLSALDGPQSTSLALGQALVDQWLLQATGASLVCVTRGPDGCSVRTSVESVELPGISVPVADTVGAGDAFTAALVCRSIEGVALAEAARFANAYAAVVVSKPGGTPTVNRAEVERLL